MNEKTPSLKKYKRKDSYGFDIDDNLSFDEYWDMQHKLEALSNAESVRAKEYRQKWHSDITQIHVKVCAKCGNEKCIC